MILFPLAGKTAPTTILDNIDQLIRADYDYKPNLYIIEQQVSFGTSGHRGCEVPLKKLDS